MKNEGPYIVEWIAHYLNIGFDGFVLYSNDCTDGTNLILNRLDAMGVVHHFDNPLGPRMDPQRRAYSRANKERVVREADWALVVDADEFLNIHAGDGTLDALLAELPANTDAVSVNWRFFGSGGARDYSDDPVTRRFTRASGTTEPENGMIWGFKTLFRPQVFDYFGVHRPRFEKNRDTDTLDPVWLNAAGRPMGPKYIRSGWRSNADVVAYDLAQVNHYAVKSRAEFLLKRLRGTANSSDRGKVGARIDLDYWDKFDLNAHEDASIRSGDLDATMARLLSDPDLAALDRAARTSARHVISDQMQDPDLAAFVAGEDGGAAEAPAAE
ncbi:glycosyltransferase family 92 protein [Rhodobacterales bacterium HKCCE3408]|nr:glycosyltransferase family 92 protein [Rhodobacterales bacterium HKCCE3408]